MKIKLPYCKFRGLFERASKPDEAHREKAPKKEVHYLDGLLGRAQQLTELASVSPWDYSISKEHQQLISKGGESFHSTER